MKKHRSWVNFQLSVSVLIAYAFSALPYAAGRYHFEPESNTKVGGRQGVATNATYIPGRTVLVLVEDRRAGGPGTRDAKESVHPPDEPVECDAALIYLDDALVSMLTRKDSHLIVIARLGRGESSRRYNQSRLSWIEAYIKKKAPEVKFVMAEGHRTSGLGVIELYVEGRLLHSLPIKKKAKFHCEEPINL